MNKKTRQNALLLVSSILACLVIIEVFSPFLYSSLTGQEFSRAEARERLQSISEFSNPESFEFGQVRAFIEMREHILHPYLGFVPRPSAERSTNRFGFKGPEAVFDRSADQWVVAITGGSVAEDFYLLSASRLEQELSKIPALAGKGITIVCLAIRGGKQPQQLMSLNFMQALGAEFDIIINIDGFNELVLPFTDNLPSKVAPYYPRLWDFYSTKSFNARALTAFFNVYTLKVKRDELKYRFDRPLVNRSGFLLVLWDIFDKRIQAEQLLVDRSLKTALAAAKPDIQVTGPVENISSEAGYLQKLMEVWINSSVQMSRVAIGADARYFHFLQPNQYVTDSKPMGEEEKAVALADMSADLLFLQYRNVAEKHFHELIAAGSEFERLGVNFTDLTKIFSDIEEPIYTDQCCHFNQQGNELMALRVAQQIADSFNNP